MAQPQSAQGPLEPDAGGASRSESGGHASDSPDLWGNGGLVGDGRYRLTHRLGRGGMAEVFAAEDVRLGRTVAVKLLRADLAEDPVSKARFTREAQSVAGLNHHAVVAVYDSGEDVVGKHTVPYIVMELVEGRTIRDLLINAEAPPPDQALIIVSGVLEALAYSHQHGIVHRDIKPANVIITNSGAVKVMDFGIARALHGAASTMTQTGMVMGTPQYLSPEQALGKAVDHRSDLYATGCLLYELLALRPPFVGETPLSVVYQHVQDTPVPPSQISDVPPELDGLVMRSLAKDPDDRFQSAEEMRGLVGYALQMLQEAGGHTGTWNTGPVTQHLGAATPPMGMAGTTALPHPASGETSQQPIVSGHYGDDDGGFDGGSGHGGSGRGRGKLWLLAVLAVIAVAVGVALALNAGDKGGDKKPEKPSTSTTKTEPSEKPTKSPSEEPTQAPDPGGSTGGNTGGWQPSHDPTYTGRPTQQPTWQPTGGQPTGEPTDEPTGTDPTGTDPTDPPDTDPTDPPDTDPTDPVGGVTGDTTGDPGGQEN
ncbi:serine/threonine protein kinase [Streptomyces pactum]|uniref:non-specific serine/threonine protein kinase n=1 Tax=Streptomyces pactum TaxID=68249 RepID=A0ABS0NLN9_9ACTN|nr:protein kinase [Streptomyces pactum]MBH5336019.1 serine/threonine protein kinase [Streptomyces pactum]